MEIEKNIEEYKKFNSENKFKFDRNLEYWDYLPLRVNFLKPFYTYYKENSNLLDLFTRIGIILHLITEGEIITCSTH